MSKKTTEDINVAIEWLNQDKSRHDKEKQENLTAQENNCEKSIWQHRSSVSKGSTLRYRNKYDTIDWSN